MREKSDNEFFNVKKSNPVLKSNMNDSDFRSFKELADQ